MVVQTIAPALFVISKPQFNSLGCFLSFLTLATGIVLGGLWLGPVGAVVGVAVSNVPLYFVVTYGLWREQLAHIGQDLCATLLFALSVVSIYACRLAIGFDLPFPGL